MIKIITKTLLCGIMATTITVNAAELTHTFSSPAFSGIGYSSHVLTVQQLENQAKERNKAQSDALAARAAAEAANTPQARFIANIESRIYAQLAKQITDSLFGTDGAPSCAAVNPYSQCGAVNIAGNDISWRLGNPGNKSEAGMIVISISGGNNSTELKVPSGTFNF